MTFDTTNVQFAEQYYHIYNARLERAKPALIENSRARWGLDVENVPLEQLSAALGNKQVFIIGTLFKHMPKQPSILKEDESFNETKNYTSDTDSLILHGIDENITIVGDIDTHEHVTGIIVSLLGHQLDSGAKFHVEDVCYPGPSLSVFKEPSISPARSNRRLLIVSGLEFGFHYYHGALATLQIVAALKRLHKFVTNDENGIERVIIAGNSVARNYNTSKPDVKADLLKMFDEYLFNVAQAGAKINIMPGKQDPTTFLLPQQPFHPKILPKAGALENVQPVTNPSKFQFDNIQVLGSSGENVDVIRQFTNIEYSTTILKNLIEWGHFAPCAPDLLSCIPFKSTDPFVLETIFDIYFVGNQPEFLSSTYCCKERPKMQLISVPGFVESKSCVLVDLKSLDCELINFQS